MAKVHATRKQIIEISDLLRLHLKPSEGGLFAYDGEWSDQKIADTVGGLNANHVAHIRSECFGKLYQRAPVDDVSALKAELAAVKAQGQAIAKNLADLWDLHAKLCATLAVNRVLDVRYLAGQKAAGLNGEHAAAVRQ